MSSKEQIQKAAMAAFRKDEVTIGTAKAMLREMSHAERRELNARLYITDDSGEPTEFDANDKPDPKGGHWHFREGVKWVEEWIAATIDPAFTVEEMKEWPDSLKRSLFEQARKINGIEPAETVAKNS